MTLAVTPQPTQKATIPSLGLSGATAGSLVTNGWNSAQSYASNAVGSANTFLSTLSTQTTALASIPVLNEVLGAATKTIGAYVAPAVPARPAELAAMASAFTVTAPVPPTLAAVTFPTAPTDVALPAVPTLSAITVPAAALLNIPTFTPVLPSAPTSAGNTFSFLEDTYASDLLASLKARLMEWVNGAATGVAPAVEQAIWDRARARETLNASQKGQEAVRAFAMRGFAKPPGMLAIELARAVQDAQDANSTLSRDVMIKQAEMEQTNRQFAMETALKLESALISYTSQVAQRGFDAARYAQQVAVEIYQHDVGRYSAGVQAYSAQVDQWKGAMQAELAKLESYKAALEGQRLIGTLNEQAVAVYSAQINAAGKVIDLYKAKVDATNALAATNKTRVESYAAEVDAYGEYFRARASQYGALADVYGKDVALYGAQVQGQTGRMGAEADAYRAEVQYQKAAADVRIEGAKANIANLTQRMGALVEAARGGAQVSAQMAAAALSAVNLSGSLSESRSASESVSRGESNSFSYGWSSSASSSDSTGTSTSTIISQ